MKKLTKIISGVMIALSVSGTVAFAENQTVRPTHDGQEVKCFLNVNWSATGNDNATGGTQLTRSGHAVGTRLYYKASSSSNYVVMDALTHSSNATISGSRKGVYRFLTEHYVYHNKNGSLVDGYQITSLSDW